MCRDAFFFLDESATMAISFETVNGSEGFCVITRKLVTRTRTRTLELLLYNLSRLLFSVHRFFLEAARMLEVAGIS
nr:hypothetical protein CFP56_66886 [Quercus suber]